MLWIGLDPGTKTGFAVWDDSKKRLTTMETLQIHVAMDYIRELMDRDSIFVIFEDARQRTWFGKDKNTSAKLQGAGSIKRDCSIWEDFLTDYGIPFRAIPPQKGCTKWSEEYFKRVTGWKGRSSNHARDAAVLVFGR